MGREQRRKEAKRNKTNIKENPELNSGVEKMSALKIGICVIVIFVFLYFILAIFVTKEIDFSSNKESDTQNSSTSVSNSILASSIFKQSEESYYVLFYGFNNDDDREVSSSVTSNLTDYKVYKVDTDSGLNKNYVSDESNPKATSISDLKVKDPTLIFIEADSISEYIEGEDNILAYLEK